MLSSPACGFQRLCATTTKVPTSDGDMATSTVVPGSRMWLKGQRRLVTGDEMLLLQAYPYFLVREQAAMFSSSIKGDLASAYSSHSVNRVSRVARLAVAFSMMAGE